MTARERRIAELAAQDLESWARQLPLGSETRRDLQQTARAYRFAARAGASAVALRAVPEARATEEPAAGKRHSASPPSGGKAADASPLDDASQALDPPLDCEA